MIVCDEVGVDESKPVNVARLVTTDDESSLNVAVTVGFTNASSIVYVVFWLEISILDKDFTGVLTVIVYTSEASK